MHRYDDETVLHLYLSVKDGNEPMVNGIQHNAVDLLTGMARDGNTEAFRALEDLAGAPMIHPILREQIRAVIGTPAPAR